MLIDFEKNNITFIFMGYDIAKAEFTINFVILTVIHKVMVGEK